MYNKVKLSKRQIKEDRFTSFMLSSKQYSQENWQFVVIGIAVLVIAIVGVSYMVSSTNTKQLEAAKRFSRALLDFRNGNNQVAILTFSQILEDFGDDQVVEQSTYMLGQIHFETKNYSEAVRYFELYLSKYKNNQLYRAACLAGIASSRENEGQSEEAAAKFWEAYQEDPEGPLAGDYIVSAMRNSLAMGDAASAQQRLDIIQDKFDGTDLEKKATRLFSEKSR